MLDSLSLEDESRLVIKGGTSLELRFGATARTSRDVDALATIELNDAFIEIADRLKVGRSGFTGVVGERTPIVRAGIAPAPERCKIKLHYRTKPFATIDFELAHADGDSFQLDELPPVDLTPVQLPVRAEVKVLGVHYQIAQKLHACTELPIDGANDRVHDLYDILLLDGLARVDGLAYTRDACAQTFRERGRHSWPPDLPQWDDWPTTWEAIEIDGDLRYPYGEARTRIEQLIHDIATASDNS